ncbi:MAG: hypothetical protein QMD16_06665, partial [Desulfitobacteriaceae bacterium]|nr:hypothetical protein [Desulfitobacteriaceae bacterium]
KPLRFPIQDVYKFDQRRIIAGRIETGSLKVGDKIHISPGNKTTKVKSIEYWAPGDQKEVVTAGRSIGITVEDEFFNNRGEIISHNQDIPETGDLFQANIFWLGKKALEKKKTYKLKLNTQEVECEIQAVQRVIDASTLETVENAQEVKLNDVAEITIRTKRPVSFDRFKDNQNTGRFVLVNGFDVSGGGIITDSTYGHRITAEKLNQVEKAENFLRELGLKDVRVRHHEQIARIEVPRKDFPLITGNILDLIVDHFEGLGFVCVTLELKGIRSGSINEALSQVNSFN